MDRSGLTRHSSCLKPQCSVKSGCMWGAGEATGHAVHVFCCCCCCCFSYWFILFIVWFSLSLKASKNGSALWLGKECICGLQLRKLLLDSSQQNESWQLYLLRPWCKVAVIFHLLDNYPTVYFCVTSSSWQLLFPSDFLYICVWCSRLISALLIFILV